MGRAPFTTPRMPVTDLLNVGMELVGVPLSPLYPYVTISNTMYSRWNHMGSDQFKTHPMLVYQMGPHIPITVTLQIYQHGVVSAHSPSTPLGII